MTNTEKLNNETLKQYYNEKRNIYKIENSSIFKVIKDLAEKTRTDYNKIDITNKELLTNIKDVIMEGALLDKDLYVEEIEKILNNISIAETNDLYKIIGVLVSRWNINLVELINKNNISKIPYCRDIIYIYLINCGIEEETALNIMEFVRKGKTNNNKYIEQWNLYIEEMKKFNISEEYINILENIKYSSSSITVENYYKLILWLSYYRIYFEKEYFSIINKYK